MERKSKAERKKNLVPVKQDSQALARTTPKEEGNVLLENFLKPKLLLQYAYIS